MEVEEAVWTRKFIYELKVVPSLVDMIFLYGITMEQLQKKNKPRSHQRSKLVLRVMPFDLTNLW